MMKQKVVLIGMLFITTILLQGCLWSLITPGKEPLPMYEREDNAKDGVVVTVDDVKYKFYPKLKWHGQLPGDDFGYAGSEEHTLSYCVNDPDMNFIFIWDEEYMPLGELHYALLYRTDKEIPAPSGESVDRIEWSEVIREGNEFDNKEKDITDEKLIRLLFDELNSNQHTFIDEAEQFPTHSMGITCYSQQVSGALYFVRFLHANGMLVAGNYGDGYVEFSPEVLEQIVGHDIDLEELIAGKDG